MKLVSYSKQLSRRGSVVMCEVVVDLPFPFGSLRSITKGIHTVGPPMWGRKMEFGIRRLSGECWSVGVDPLSGQSKADPCDLQNAYRAEHKLA